LSYFSTFGLAGGSHYTGLALDNNSLVLVFVFAFEGLFSPETFSLLLYATGMVLAALNVSQIKTPKLSGNPMNVYLLGTYTLAITGIFCWRLI
jgi:CDP-diacylglycerol--serine O-phosphatidyltransferase